MKCLAYVFLLIFATGLDFECVTGNAANAVNAPWPTDDIPSGIENRGLVCVALAVYAEARGESYFGQALVANVIINRQALLPYGSDACDVINIPGQFEGMDKWGYPRHPWLEERHAWDVALEVATVVATGDYYIPPPCQAATYFRARDTPIGTLPAWGDLTYLCSVEHHEFFTVPNFQPSTLAATTGGMP